MPESTMIYVTHDQVEAMTLADRIVVLAGGGIAQVGSPADALRETRLDLRGAVHRLALDEP
jgi:ABC-type sugar transport system ATPase subunit